MKYNYMSKMFPKMDLKFYFNITTHNQTYIGLVIPLLHFLFLVLNMSLALHSLYSPQKNFPNNTWVCALIDEENNCWMEDKVHEEFLPHEAEAILSLPLSFNGKEDRLI